MKEKKKIKDVFKSARFLIIVLMILIIILMVLCYHLMNSSKTYMFNGKSYFVNINNGVISLNYDINMIEGTDITYINKKDYDVIKYKIGYYVKFDNKYLEVVTNSGSDDTGLSLKGLVNEMLNFNLTEPYVNKNHFSKDIKRELNHNLYFIIEATTKDNKIIKDITSINVSKLSK